MQKLIIPQGIPASGKSTYCRELALKFPLTHVIANRDQLRRMAGEYLVNSREGLITKWERYCVTSALEEGFNVIIDATNLNPKTIKAWEVLVAEHNKKREVEDRVTIEYKRFDTPLEECLRRDALRKEAVGEAVIKEFYYKYMVDKIVTVEELPIRQDENLPHAIICDLDGTMCLHNGRGPFEYDKCNTDLLNHAVARIVQSYCNQYGYSRVIYMSGREDFCREKSQEWLTKHDLFGGLLYMRATGDHRKDVIIKKELFDNHIKDKFFIDFCLDDRDQVVKLWRSMGLPCMQVNYGDF